MTFANLLIGLAIGLPMMIAVGPISVLLLDQGLERGVRPAAPAALGVAAADLTFAAIAAVAGASVTALLAPIEGWLTIAAVAVLAWLAFDLARAATADLRALRPAPTLVTVGGGGAALGHGGPLEREHGSSFGHLRGVRLAAAFYGLTMVNPLTIVLFASVVIAGGTGVGSAGWALGMALASLVAHSSFVVLGGVLGTTLGPVANARLRIGAAVFMGALALHFALAA
jgi:threonine/homoserine/homoserine lactone efflux protein